MEARFNLLFLELVAQITLKSKLSLASTSGIHNAGYREETLNQGTYLC